MSPDFTGGYGPEEFSLREAKPGKYKVEANYYGNRQQIVAGATTLQLELMTGFGTAKQKGQTVTAAAQGQAGGGARGRIRGGGGLGASAHRKTRAKPDTPSGNFRLPARPRRSSSCCAERLDWPRRLHRENNMASVRWLALPLAALPCTLLAATAYVAVPIGSLGGVSTYGTAINASGQIAGWGDTDAAGAIHRHAFVFSNGVLTNLGTLPGGTQSFAYAINNAGQVSGASNAGGVPQLHAVLFSAGVVTDLATLVGGTISNAYGINDRGDVAGASNRTGIAHGYLAQSGSGVAVDIGTLGGSLSQAYGINAAAT
jgi:probable HAF family extracellular repeat protein